MILTVGIMGAHGTAENAWRYVVHSQALPYLFFEGTVLSTRQHHSGARDPNGGQDSPPGASCEMNTPEYGDHAPSHPPSPLPAPD